MTTINGLSVATSIMAPVTTDTGEWLVCGAGPLDGDRRSRWPRRVARPG